MEICNNYHEEIIFDSGKCPLCEAIGTIGLRDDELENLRTEIDDLKDTILENNKEIDLLKG